MRPVISNTVLSPSRHLPDDTGPGSTGGLDTSYTSSGWVFFR